MKALALFVSVCAALSAGTASPALALANRVFVSARSGNNANACDNINTPCQTFAGAVAQLNPGGEALVLDTGGYGSVTITKSLTIAAPPGVLAFIHPPSGGDAVTVNAAGATVVLRGLTIDGAGATTGDGINAVAVSVLHVESCVISGFAGSVSGGTGIDFASTGLLFVKDTIVRGHGQMGIWVHPSTLLAQASVERCRLEQNVIGLWSGGGVGIAETTIKDSVASGNSNTGLVADTGPSDVNAEGCVVADNLYGLVSRISATLRVSNCTVTSNNTGVLAIASGSLLSRSNNTVEGNGTNGSFTGTYAAK